MRHIPGLHENADVLTIQDRSGFRRPAGTATHPIEFGCVIAMALPLALHLARFDTARSAVRRWLPMMAIAIGIPVAVSRSAVLGAAVAGLVIFLGLDPKVRPRALVAVSGFLVVIYATTPGLLGTLRGLFLSTGSDSRINDYAPALADIRQSPWFGHGPGTFVADATIGNVLDNQYLLSLIEIGIVGMAIVLAYLLAASFLGRGARHRSSDPATRDLGQAFAAASLSSAATAYTFDALTFRMFAGVVPLCLGLSGLLWALQRDKDAPVAARPLAQAGLAPPLSASALAPLPAPPVEQVEPVEPIAPPVPLEPAAVEAATAEPAPAAGDERPAVPTAVGAFGALGDLGDLGEADTVEHDDLLAALDGELAGVPLHTYDGLPLPAPAGEAPVHDLRRVAVLIGAGAAVVVLVGLPFIVERDDRGNASVAQVGISAGPGLTSASTSSTTFLGQPSRKAARLRARAARNRAARAGAAPVGGTIVPGGTDANPAAPPAAGGPTTTVASTPTTVPTATTTTEPGTPTTTETTTTPTTEPPTTTTEPTTP
jgi:hypothetical protein